MSNDVNQARAYGVRVLPATALGQRYWRVVEVRHLAPAENRGKRNVFVDVVDEAGNRINDPTLRIGWRWEGQRADEQSPPARLDKPQGEPAGDIPLNPNQKLTIWIIGRYLVSDAVEGLHSMHPDEYAPDGFKGNYTAHHSFYVRFALAQPATTEEPSTEEPPAKPDLQTQIDALAARLLKVEQWLERLVGEL
jgi:hypothetical protein